MHPIERLRWIARAEEEPAASLAGEAAWTLGELARQEPTAFLTASRRLLDRHPACGPLWWVSARLAAAEDPFEAGRRASAELCSDPTPERIGGALRAGLGDGDVVVLLVPLDLAAAALESCPPHPLRLVGDPWALRRSMRLLPGAVSGEVSGWSPGEESEAVAGAAVVLVEVLAAGPERVLATAGTGAVVRAARERSVPVWALVGVGRALPERLFEAAADWAGGGADQVGLDSFALGISAEGVGDPRLASSQVTCPPRPELIRRLV